MSAPNVFVVYCVGGIATALLIAVGGLNPWGFAAGLAIVVAVSLIVRGIYALGKRAARKETDL